MATSFSINQADLAFILKQIRIAELHSGGMALTDAIQTVYGTTISDAALVPFGLRTVDGSLNNLRSAAGREFGAADTLFPRLTDPVFLNDADGDSIDFDGPAGAPPVVQGNYGLPGNVVDADPRIISNLIDNQTAANPAAVQAALNHAGITGAAATTARAAIATAHAATLGQPDATLRAAAETALTNLLTSYGIVQGPGGTLEVLNASPDVGLSPSFNSWMTFFGQFFDHGLDLVTKGGNGTVYMPLQPDDPLIAGADKVFGTADDLPAQLRFMALTRATPTNVNGVPQHENTTTSWVDQNQTYTSHPSHQVFLREYTRTGNVTSATGKLLDGTTAGGSLDGAIANWGETKAHALTMLGINLTDQDVHNVPLLLTDQYGKFVPSATGYAQVVTAVNAAGVPTAWVSGTAAGLTLPANTVRTGHAFLNDIAHHAAPNFIDTNRNGIRDPGEVLQTPDTLAGVADDNNPLTYDDEMLNSHFITGDGRGNENIALTAVHSIFHSEHNRLVEANKATILASNDLAFINEWLLVDVPTLALINTTPLQWDGERLFQAARFVTEMQYQHMVFEEFARRIQPNVDPFIFTNTADIDGSILAEFAHTVYRFGHSMLTDTVDRLDNDLTPVNADASQQTLIAAFLNPQMYLAGGATIEEVNADLIRGLTRDVGNEIDEFVVPALQTNLLGLPLDLPALNIARGRDTGIPSLNETRAQLFTDFGGQALRPYTSWSDFAQNLKNPLSIINFVAAYGTHPSITGATTLAAKRAAAMELVLGTDQGSGAAGVPADRVAFMTATGAFAGGTRGGLNLVDLWIGGLAEKKTEFGGMLGTTFNFIFEYQMERLQNADRMYYLTRTQGTNLLNQLEPNTFSDIVMRNTELGGIYSTHMSGALFLTPDYIIELDRGIAQETPDPVHEDELLQAIDPKVVRDYTGSTIVDGTHDFGGSIAFRGGEHVVVGGTEGNDRIVTDIGDDTVWGDGGNDFISSGDGVDDVFGGEGDDIIIDPFGDGDVLRGNQGNDVIDAGPGIGDLIFGDAGQDFIIVGQDPKEAFAGQGNDFIRGGTAQDFLLGNEGDDWIEGGDGFDTIAGENSELFFNSPIIGHDVLWGQGNDQDYDAESGDDIMLSGPGVQRFEGMFGFDWAISKFDPAGARFDFQIPIFTTVPGDILRDRFDQNEAASGWIHDDTIIGDDRGFVAGLSAPTDLPTLLFAEHMLTQAGIDRIAGLNALLQGARQTLFGDNTVAFHDGNILLGGDGNDTLQGRAGYDILDGDAWLNVRIAVSGAVPAGVPTSFDSLDPLIPYMLDGRINPGQLSIVREILDGTVGGETDTDTAVFRGNLAEYDIEGRTDTVPAADVNGDGFISVKDRDNGLVGAVVNGVQLDSRALLVDNTDLLKNIERLQFADQLIAIGGNNGIATGTASIVDATPFDKDGDPATAAVATPHVGQVLRASLAGVNDANGVTMTAGLPAGLTWDWQVSTLGLNAGWVTVLNTTGNYTVRPDDVGLAIRAVAVFKDDTGVTERIVSGVSEGPTVPFSVNENSPTGTLVANQIPFLPGVDIDPSTGLGPNAIVALTHVIPAGPANSAGGRFAIVNNQLRVGPNGGQVNLNYEDLQNPVDNQYQIVVETYTDTLANGGLLLNRRQFTIMLNNLAEALTAAPTDIQWNGITPAISALPAANSQIAQLSTVDSDSSSWTYTLQPGSSGNFAVNPNGQVSRTGNAMGQNQTYTLNIRSTDDSSAFRDETFVIRTGDDNGNTISVPFTTIDNIVYGDDGNDTLTGSDGNDTLFGMDENDTLQGGAGNDVLNGGAADSDTASYSLAAVSVNVSLAITGPQNPGAGLGFDTLVDIENLTGSAQADTLIGNGGANALTGGAGNDRLIGQGGGDNLNGGDGDDILFGDNAVRGTIVGTVGNDVLNGGAGNDTASYAGAASAVTVTLADTAQQNTVSAGLDTLTNIENLIGSDFNDNLTGSAGANVLTGGLGNDIFDGNAGSDTASYATATGPVTANLQTQASSGAAGIDVLNNIENLIGSDFVDNLTGSNVANIISGGGGADIIAINSPNNGIDDDILDIVRFTATADYGDTISQFDANGGVGVADRVEFTAALNTLFDDGTNDDNIAFVTDNNINNDNAAVNLNGTNEALFLDGANTEGVTTASLGVAAQVAAEFNAEFAITAADGEATLLVINDTNGNSASIWQWIQTPGGTAEIDVNELALIGIVNANATITAAGSFDFA
jgi:Ca2+-binding RTX toxin-like protein